MGIVNFEKYFHSFNYAMFIMKYFVSQSKHNQEKLVFLKQHTIKSKRIIDKRVYVQSKRQDVFAKRFSILTDKL